MFFCDDQPISWNYRPADKLYIVSRIHYSSVTAHSKIFLVMNFISPQFRLSPPLTFRLIHQSLRKTPSISKPDLVYELEVGITLLRWWCSICPNKAGANSGESAWCCWILRFRIPFCRSFACTVLTKWMSHWFETRFHSIGLPPGGVRFPIREAWVENAGWFCFLYENRTPLNPHRNLRSL